MKNYLDDDDLIVILGFVSEELGTEVVPQFETNDSEDEVIYTNEEGEKVQISYKEFIKKYLNVKKVAELICEFEDLDSCDVGYLFDINSDDEFGH